MDNPHNERAQLPNISRAAFCIQMRVLCMMHSERALAVGNDCGFDYSGCLELLALDMFVEGITQYTLRAYLRAGCNVRFQGE
jgi:hypothetical protein